jgi:hypothetical protein
MQDEQVIEAFMHCYGVFFFIILLLGNKGRKSQLRVLSGVTEILSFGLLALLFEHGIIYRSLLRFLYTYVVVLKLKNLFTLNFSSRFFFTSSHMHVPIP